MAAAAQGGLARYFRVDEAGSSVRTELVAGLTTFLTMSYIVFVNPSILADAGVPREAATFATCLAAGVGSLLMGLWARHPVALAPGMGLNAYFAYSVVGGMGVSWQTALGAVFFSGVAFVLLSLTGLRKHALEAIPRELQAAIAAGIGLFLALIGLRNAGLVVPSEATVAALGDLSRPESWIAVGGLLVMAALEARGVRAAVLVGIVGGTVVALLAGISSPGSLQHDWGAMTAATFQFDLGQALSLGLLEVIFAFLFVDFFDTVGTLIAVTRRAGLVNENGEIPRVNRMLTVDAVSTVVGACAGTSTTTAYIESAAGVDAGGRTGLTAATTGVLFLLAIGLGPLIGVVPASAVAPALIVVGAAMMSALSDVDWRRAETAIPAFLTMVAIPFTFSIATGIAVGFLAYDALRIARGKAFETPVATHVLALIFLARFVYLAAT